MYALLHEQTNVVEITGSYAECLIRFAELCDFSYERHHAFCYDTYALKACICTKCGEDMTSLPRHGLCPECFGTGGWV